MFTLSIIAAATYFTTGNAQESSADVLDAAGDGIGFLSRIVSAPSEMINEVVTRVSSDNDENTGGGIPSNMTKELPRPGMMDGSTPLPGSEMPSGAPGGPMTKNMMRPGMKQGGIPSNMTKEMPRPGMMDGSTPLPGSSRVPLSGEVRPGTVSPPSSRPDDASSTDIPVTATSEMLSTISDSTIVVPDVTVTTNVPTEMLSTISDSTTVVSDVTVTTNGPTEMLSTISYSTTVVPDVTVTTNVPTEMLSTISDSTTVVSDVTVTANGSTQVIA